MLISTKGRYALKIMLELAGNYSEENMPLPVIAESQGISEKYLEGIISLLVKGGLVEGMRGKGGGYRLTKNPEEYSIGEILRLAEGSLAPVACLEGPNKCEKACGCKTLPLWEKLDELICGYLDSVNLKELLDNN